MRCAFCGGNKIHTNWVESSIDVYVPGYENRTIPTIIPIRFCQECNKEFTDFIAEEILDVTAKKYILSLYNS